MAKSVLILSCALLAVALAEPAGAEPCTPPANTVSNRVYNEAYADAYCKAFSLSSGATIPVEGLPINFELAGSKNSCGSSGRTVSESVLQAQQYLATDRSLLVAECGFRMCELHRSGGDNRALSLLKGICSGDADSISGAGSAGIGASLIENVVYVEWKKGARERVALFARNHNPTQDIEVVFTAIDSGIKVRKKKQRIAAGKSIPVYFDIQFDKKAPLLGAPRTYRVDMEHKGAVVPAAFEVYSSTANFPRCVKWRGGKCAECVVPFSFSAQQSESVVGDGQCVGMDPALSARVTMQLKVTDVGRRASDGTVWATFDLESGGKKTGAGSDSRPIPAAHGLTLSGIKPSADGKVEARVSMTRCTSWDDTNCTGSGTIQIVQ